MCLQIPFFSFRRKARRDIPVIKALRREGDKLVTPFRSTEFTFNEVMESELDRVDLYTVEAGLHSAIDMKAAGAILREVQWVDAVNDQDLADDLVFYKAIIPKGSYYYKGIWGLIRTSDSYASDKLIILDEQVILEDQYA